MEKLQNDFDRMHETIKEVHTKINHMDNQIVLLRIDVAGLKIKSGIWGFAAGILPAIAFYLVEIFRR